MKAENEAGDSEKQFETDMEDAYQKITGSHHELSFGMVIFYPH